jgi:uncharacterized protein (TIGR02996 family)
MPRYELRDGTASKFWSIERDAKGKAFTVTWGRIGTDGQRKKQKFAQPYLCGAAYVKLIDEKLAKGYRISSGSPPATRTKRNAALEAAIEESPADTERWLVYADWLQQEGDPRGELIALRAAKKTAKANAYAKQHASELWSTGAFLATPKPFAGRTWEGWSNEGDVEYESLGAALAMSRLGFVHAATFTGLDEDGHVASAVGDLLDAPLGRFVQELHFTIDERFEGLSGQPNYQLVANAIAHGAPRALRVLTFDRGGYQRSWTSSGDLSRALAVTPRLERLDIELGDIDLGKRLQLPALKILRLVTGGLRAHNLRAIAAADWPELEELVVYFGTERYGANATMKDVRALLAGSFPKLRRLALCNSEALQSEIAAAIVDTKLVGKLEHLDLSKGTLTDGDVEPLLAAAGALKHLTLDLSENYLSAAGEKALRTKLGKRVVLDGQRYDDMVESRERYGNEDWAKQGKHTFRYAAISE